MHYTILTFITPATTRQSTINAYGVSCGKQLHNINNGNNIVYYIVYECMNKGIGY